MNEEIIINVSDTVMEVLREAADYKGITVEALAKVIIDTWALHQTWLNNSVKESDS